MRILSLLGRVHRWMAAHFTLTAAAAGLVLLLLGLLCARATTEQDIGALLPDGPGSPREAARLLGEFGTLNTLLLDLEIPGATRDQLAEEGGRLAEKLRRSGAFAEVYTGPTTHEKLALSKVLLPRRLYLLEDPTTELERRLEHSRLAASLSAVKAQLASPQAFAMKGELLTDPLGFNADLVKAVAQMAGEVELYRGQLLSKDGRHLLLVTTPKQNALDTRASRALLEALERESAQLDPGPLGPAILRSVGGPRFATESATAARRDVVLTLATSALGLLALFVARFRSIRLLMLASIPLGFGMSGGVAALVFLQGRVHALSLAFGAVLIGVAIDYPIHLLNAASIHEEEPLERISRALGEIWQSVWLGFGTTVLAFAVMLFSPFPGLRELGLFAAAGVASAFVTTLVLLPPLCARWGPRSWPGIPSWMPRLQRWKLAPALAWAVTLLLIMGCVGLVRSLRFDGELRNLDAQRPETLADYEEVIERFGMRGSGSLLVARGRTAEETLRLNDTVAELLARLEEGGQVSGGRGIGSILPSRATQERRARRLADLDVPRSRAEFAKVAAEAGFSSDAFDGFWQEVEAVRDGRVAPLGPEDFKGTALEPLLQRLLRCSAEECIAVTPLVLADPGVAISLSRSLPSGVFLVDAGALAEEAVAEIPRQLALLSGLGLFLNAALLTFVYRSLWRALAACLPCCLGLLGTLAILAAYGVPLNLVSATALVLILGCGVDYGIFVLQQLSGEKPASCVESTGVLMASVTTLAGFGTLTLASYRALQSLGLAVGLGILVSAAAALFLLPALTQPIRARAARAEPGGAR